MKKLITVALMAMTAASAFAAETIDSTQDPSLPKGLKLKKMTPEERQRMKEKFYRKMGGFVENRKDMKGNVQYLNGQTLVPEAKLADTVAALGKFTKCDFRLAKGAADVTPVTAAKARTDANANAAIFLVENDTLPVFLVAPEEKWAMVNVRALAKDKPSAEDLATRVTREMWRGLGFLTATDSMDANCLMRPIFSVNDLDNIGVNGLSQEPLVKMSMRLPAMGVKPYRTASYRKACQEGWAASPTNDVEKAIWDEVHALPDKPMKIKFDPKRDK